MCVCTGAHKAREQGWAGLVLCYILSKRRRKISIQFLKLCNFLMFVILVFLSFHVVISSKKKKKLMSCVLAFGDWKMEEAEKSDNLQKEARGKRILQGQRWCSQLLRVESGESQWGCLEEERKQQVQAAESPGAQQCNGHHGYLTNPYPISPCLALKIRHCSSSDFTFLFSLSVKCVIHARNLPKALPCFSHPSFIITLPVLSILPP